MPVAFDGRACQAGSSYAYACASAFLRASLAVLLLAVKATRATANAHAPEPADFFSSSPADGDSAAGAAAEANQSSMAAARLGSANGTVGAASWSINAGGESWLLADKARWPVLMLGCRHGPAAAESEDKAGRRQTTAELEWKNWWSVRVSACGKLRSEDFFDRSITCNQLRFQLVAARATNAIQLIHPFLMTSGRLWHHKGIDWGTFTHTH